MSAPDLSRVETGLLGVLARRSIEHPGLTLTIWTILLVASAAGAGKLQVETSTDSVLDRTDPAWQFYREATRRFGGDEVVVAALKSERPWDPELLATIRDITEAIEDEPGVRRVDSLASVPMIHVANGGELELDPAIPSRGAISESVAARVKTRAEFDRFAPGLLVSTDGRTFSITVLMEDLGAGHDEQTVRLVRTILGERAYWISGGPVFRTETNTQTQSELITLLPVTMSLMTGLLFFVIRSAIGVVCLQLVGAVSVFLVFGAMGALGAPLTLTTVILPSVLLALASAYGMHVLVAAERVSGQASRTDLAQAISAVVRPISFSGLTTSIGFGAMALVRIDVIRFVGGFGALGALVVLLATLSLLPALLSIYGRRIPVRSKWIGGPVASTITRFVIVRPKLISTAWVLLLVILTIGISRLDVETDVILWFPEGMTVRDDYERIKSELVGISPMNVVIDAPTGRSVLEPGPLAAIDALSSFIETQPEMGRSLSIGDMLRQIHGGFIDDPTQPLPPSRDASEQYLLLLESVDHVDDFVTAERDSANISLRVNDNGSSALLGLAERTEAWWRTNGVEGFTANTTGIMHEYARSEHEIESGQLRGLAFAFLAVGAVLLLILKSWKLAVLALVPNAMPIAMIFGAMGIAGIPVDAGTVLLGSLALGIAVDDTIHLATGYRDGRNSGLQPAEALGAAMSASLPAISFSTIAIAGGFIALGFSNFTLVRNLGLLTSFVMLSCLLADVLLLPALLLQGDRHKTATP